MTCVTAPLPLFFSLTLLCLPFSLHHGLLMTSHASAPGKLFLFGEYAVLGGGWALVAATDRAVHVDYDEARHGYEVVGAPLTADTRLPRAAMRALGEHEDRVEHLRADLSELYVDGQKLGLGSSAASTIASMLAVKPDLHTQPMHLFDRAFAAHRDIQNGKGSGADVACAAFGGLIAYRLKVPQAPLPGISGRELQPLPSAAQEQGHAWVVRDLSLPGTLRIEAVWTGKPASSTVLIGKIEAALPSMRDVIQVQLDAMATHAATVMSVLMDTSMDDDRRVARIVECAHSVNDAMDILTRDTGAPILTRPHELLWHVAHPCGIAVKVSGAGGGDFSLLMGHQDADWDTLLATLPQGCTHIPLQFGVARQPVDMNP